MDAVKYVKTLHRLCKSQDGCSECVLESEDGCIAAANRYDKNAVPIVKQWAKEHPTKTRQSEFLKLFPNAEIDEDDGILCIKPCAIDKRIGCTNGKGCDGCFRKYWLAEVTEND